MLEISLVSMKTICCDATVNSSGEANSERKSSLRSKRDSRVCRVEVTKGYLTF